MTARPALIPNASHYWLRNANVPRALFAETFPSNPDVVMAQELEQRLMVLGDDLVAVDLEIRQGVVHQCLSSSSSIEYESDDADRTPNIPTIDLRRKQLWPCFADMHTHLDKGHIWERTPNRDRTFAGALAAVQQDGQYWTPDDLYRRMEFGLKCSYAHGTASIRTHLDSFHPQAEISFGVFRQLQQAWSDKLVLQAVCLVPLDYFLGGNGEALIKVVADTPHGILGAVAFPSDDLDTELDRVFVLAKEYGLDLDFHVDESGNPHDDSLRHIARAALRHHFKGQITCGHCCSLAIQPPSEVRKTIAMVREADIGIVSLPLCNLYLQDRQQEASGQLMQMGTAVQEKLVTGMTPRWRGVTLLHELKNAGVKVAIANDNCRDPFHGFGDHDMLEVFNLSARIAHLDLPYGNWVDTVAKTPADLMGLSKMGRIGSGLPADFVIFNARTFSELLSRPQSQRTVVRQGRVINTDLPAYEELDDLLQGRFFP